jgi:hypothetical protein
MRISEQIRAKSEISGDADLVMKQVERWTRSFEAAVDKILGGIDDYTKIMKKISGLPHPSAKHIGQRGVNTSKAARNQWITIKDDLFALKTELRQDSDDDDD